MLERIRNDTQISSISEDVAVASGDEERNGDAEHEEFAIERDVHPCNDGDDAILEENPAHLLEELMRTLDEPGKQALFAMLTSTLEQEYGPEAQGVLSAASEQPNEEISEETNTPLQVKKERETTSLSTSQSTDLDSQQQQQHDTTEALEAIVEDIESLGLNYEQILSRLPKNLADSFKHKVAQRNFADILLLWSPWWTLNSSYDQARPQHDKFNELDTPAEPPPLPKPSDLVVPLEIARKKASPLLLYSAIDIIAATCTSLRLANGDWQADSIHVAKKLWQLSSVIAEDSRFTSERQACRHVMERIALEESYEVAVRALSDAADVFSGGSDWIARALYECHCVLTAAANEIGNRENRKAVQARARKLGFFVSWSLCNSVESFGEAARAVLSFVEQERGRSEEVLVAARVAKAARDRQSGHPGITVLE